MIASWWIAAALVLGQSEPPAEHELAQQVAKLVAQLDAPQKATRDAAEAALEALGPDALDALQAIDADAPAETVERLRRVRGRLELERARQTVEASRVTLAGADLPLADVLAAFTSQTGNPLIDYRGKFGQQPLDVKLSLNLDDVPFWKALDQVLDQADLDTYAYASQQGLALVRRSPARAPRVGRAVYADCFRIEPVDVQAHRAYRETTGDVLQLTLDAAWEPRVKPIMILAHADRVRAVDEHGRALKLAEPVNRLEINVAPGTMAVELPIRFELPPRDAHRIARLEGAFDCLAPGRIETFRFDALAADQRAEIKKAAATVALEGVRKNRDVWEVRLRVTFDEAREALDSHRRWIFNNECYLEAADGKKTANAGYEAYRQAPNEIGLAYLFTVESVEGLSLVYKTPAMILSVPLAFELVDLELP